MSLIDLSTRFLGIESDVSTNTSNTSTNTTNIATNTTNISTNTTNISTNTTNISTNTTNISTHSSQITDLQADVAALEGANPVTKLFFFDDFLYLILPETGSMVTSAGAYSKFSMSNLTFDNTVSTGAVKVIHASNTSTECYLFGGATALRADGDIHYRVRFKYTDSITSALSKLCLGVSSGVNMSVGVPSDDGVYFDFVSTGVSHTVQARAVDSVGSTVAATTYAQATYLDVWLIFDVIISVAGVITVKLYSDDVQPATLIKDWSSELSARTLDDANYSFLYTSYRTVTDAFSMLIDYVLIEQDSVSRS